MTELDLDSFDELPTIDEFKEFQLKKSSISGVISYALFLKDDPVGMLRLRKPTKLWGKFPKFMNPNWQQTCNLYIDHNFRRMGLATFLYNRIIETEDEIISDDGQTEQTIQLWRNKLIPNKKFKIFGIDLTTGQKIDIKSIEDFDKNKIWVYQNHKVYLAIAKST